MSRRPWLMDVLADEFRGVKGFRVDAYPGFETRGSTVFDPSHVMDHHTGAGAYNNLLNYMAEGPVHPPLCNYATSRPAGGVVRVTVVAAGRANHAGRGSYPSILLNQGNRFCFGGEHQNDGRQAWPGQQVEAMRRCDAAILKRLGRDTGWMLDHKTYAPGRKADRHTLKVVDERRAVTRRLLEEDDMPLDDKDLDRIRQLIRDEVAEIRDRVTIDGPRIRRGVRRLADGRKVDSTVKVGGLDLAMAVELDPIDLGDDGP